MNEMDTIQSAQPNMRKVLKLISIVGPQSSDRHLGRLLLPQRSLQILPRPLCRRLR